MNKTELIAEISENVNMSKRDIEYILAATLDSITNAMMRGDSVQLFGFGTFEVRERAERKALNPRTKEPITVPATKTPAFKAGKALKDVIA